MEKKLVKTEEITELENALAELDDVPPLEFDDGVKIAITDINGLHERWLRVASDGFMSSQAELFQQLATGSYEAFGALYWLGWLTQNDAKPSDEGALAYDDALARIDAITVAKLGEKMTAGEADPT